MALITDPDDLNVGTEISIDTSAKTFTLNVAGNLVAKDGVTINALWAKFVDLWTTSTYQPYPFPMNVLDAKSGQYIFGQDPGGTYNGWKPAGDTTRQRMRSGGWSEYSSAGVLNRRYVGIVSLGDVSTGAQLYYQRVDGGTAYDFTFTDEVNEGIQIFGDSGNGNFDNQAYFKGYVREYSKKYKDSVLGDTGQSTTGAYIVNLLLSNEDDLKITANDAAMTGAPYTSIGLEYFGTNQSKTIGGSSYNFRVIIDNTTANATLEQIYTKMQFNLRQATDIDDGSGSVVGKTASQLCYFVGDTLYTTAGVFIDGVIAADLNRVKFLPYGSSPGAEVEYPYASAGTLNFSSNLVGGYYRMYFTNDDSGANAGNDYGTATAITVKDNSVADITGTISSTSINFTFDYDGNIQRGNTLPNVSPTDDAPVTIVAGNAGSAKPVVATGTITRSKSISITLTAETDRAYLA